jgi:hypothetical protein
VVAIVRVDAPGAFPFAGVGRLASTYMSVRWPTPNVPAETAGGAVVVVGVAVVVVGRGTLDDVVERARVPVPPPPHAARIATTAVVVSASAERLGRPGRVRALIGTASTQETVQIAGQNRGVPPSGATRSRQECLAQDRAATVDEFD